MQLNKKHFELFKKECEYWVNKLEINGWSVYYKMKDLGKSLGECHTNLLGRSAIIMINEFYLCDRNEVVSSIKQTAKHEIIHLLLARLSTLGSSRFLDEDSIYEAEEELVVKLEKLL